MSGLYIAIRLETLLPQSLPGIPLFIKRGVNFVLYKNRDLLFTKADRDRLISNNITELYVRSGDISNYNKYVENNLPVILKDDNIEPIEKQIIFCQASVNCVREIYESPARSIKSNIDRCRFLIQQILAEMVSTEAILSILGTLVEHNSYTYVHSLQVATYSLALHSKMFLLSHDELVDVGIGSIFHDFGKIYVPNEIIEKTGKLTAEEFHTMKQHPVEGYNILKTLDTFTSIALGIVKHHHEKENGKGYPDGLSGNGISRSSKITAIADVYSALTTERPYREALSKEVALDTMYNEMEGSFDSHYLDSFSDFLSGT